MYLEISLLKQFTRERWRWQPLIQILAEDTLAKYLEHDGVSHVYLQWLPEDFHANMDEETFKQLTEKIDHIILYDNNTMEMVHCDDISQMDFPSF